MSAKDQIISLLNRYSHTVDSGDLDGFVDLFSHGEWYVEGTKPNRGPKEIFDNVISKIILPSVAVAGQLVNDKVIEAFDVIVW